MIKAVIDARASISIWVWALIFVSVLVLGLGLSQPAFGAACCGGGVAAPNLIMGDDAHQIGMTYSHSNILTDVYSDGTWHDRTSNETSEVFRLDAATMISDRFQISASLPLQSRSRESQSASGLGDVSFSGAYEFLPEWEYNPFIPKGVGYLQLTTPTGRSVYEDKTGIEARGRGFWAIGVGALFTKVIRSFDFVAGFDLHRSFSKEVHSEILNATVIPGYGGSATIGAGYNLAEWRAGASLTWFYEDPLTVETATNNSSSSTSSTGSLQRYAALTASLSYLANDNWSFTASLSDQSLIGSPLNTSLGRSAGVLIVRRWPL